MWNGNENELSFWFFVWEISLILGKNDIVGGVLGNSFSRNF